MLRVAVVCAVAAHSILPVAATAHPQEGPPEGGAATAVVPRTPGEASGYLSFTSAAAAHEYLSQLAASEAALVLDTLALAAAGPGEAGSLVAPLARLREPGAREAARHVRVLVLAAQHGDEVSGLEATLRLARELAAGELRSSLEEMDVALLPVLNPWGLDAGQRRDADGVDLNRDHFRLASPVTRALHKLFGAWRPDVVLDLHEVGPTPYAIQIGLPTHPNSDPALAAFGRYYLLPYVARELTRASALFSEYVVAEPAPDPESPAWTRLEPGLDRLPEAEDRSGPPSPDSAAAYLTFAPIHAPSARNAFSLHGSLALLVEVASSRELDGLAERTDHLYRTLKALFEVIPAHAPELRRRIESARRLPGPAGTREPLALRARNAPDPERPTVTRLAWSRAGTLAARSSDRWRPGVHRLLEIRPPGAWLLDPHETELARLIAARGFRVHRLEGPATVRVGAYPGLPRDAETPPAEDDPAGWGSPPVDAAPHLLWAERAVPAGAFLVPADQTGGRLLFTLLEPWSEDGWFAGSPRGSSVPVARVERLPATVSVTTLDGPDGAAGPGGGRP